SALVNGLPIEEVGSLLVRGGDLDRPSLFENEALGRIRRKVIAHLHVDARGMIAAALELELGDRRPSFAMAGRSILLPVVDAVHELPTEPEPVVPRVIGRTSPGEIGAARRRENIEVRLSVRGPMAKAPDRPLTVDERDEVIADLEGKRWIRFRRAFGFGR